MTLKPLLTTGPERWVCKQLINLDSEILETLKQLVTLCLDRLGGGHPYENSLTLKQLVTLCPARGSGGHPCESSLTLKQ